MRRKGVILKYKSILKYGKKVINIVISGGFAVFFYCFIITRVSRKHRIKRESWIFFSFARILPLRICTTMGFQTACFLTYFYLRECRIAIALFCIYDIYCFIINYNIIHMLISIILHLR